MDKKKLWKSILLDIESSESIATFRFENLIMPIIPLHFANGVLLLKAQNQFSLEALNGKFRSIILETGQKHTSKLKSVRFTIEDSVPLPKRDKPQIDNIDKKDYKKEVHKTGIFQHPLKKEFTFDAFINVEENSFALKSAIAIADKPGTKTFNPLFIYGGVGSGKTHLLHAIGNRTKRTRPNSKIVITTADEFFQNYSSLFRSGDRATKNARKKSFNKTFTNADILIFDDIHLISGREGSQTMLFQFFNHLHQKGKQMVFAAHCSPEKLQGIDDRLISRFAWGLAVEIKPPITETKMAILSGIAKNKGIDLSNDVLSYLAENGPSNVRELEGIIIRLLFQSSISKAPITVDITKELITKPASSEDGKFHIADILHCTLQHFNVDKELLMSKSRSKEVALCRQVGMYIAKLHTNHSLKSVGIEFGRDHSTVSHAMKTIEKQRATDTVLDNDIKTIIKKINEI